MIDGTVEVKVRCTGAQACQGVAKLILRVEAKRRKRAQAHASRRRRAKRLVIGRKRFVVAPGSAGIVAIELNHRGKQLMGKAGKDGLKVQLAGTGLKARALRLRPR